jgi:DNA recombination protein RmuC
MMPAWSWLLFGVLTGAAVGWTLGWLVASVHGRRLKVTLSELTDASLRTNSEVFLQIAREHLGQQHLQAAHTLKEREQAIETLVKPIHEALRKTEAQIQSIERERRDAFVALKTHLEGVAQSQSALQLETRNLVNALRRPEVRGQWGELSLQRLVELAGMTAHCDFTEQMHTATEDGALRPDMVVHMPDGRDLVVDVKTPLDAYLEAVDAPNDEVRAAALKRHGQIVAEQVRKLSAKAYWSQFERSPDFVILFIPGDQFLSAALNERPGLLDEAIRQNVILATPTSFIAMLKAIAYGWRQLALAQNAATIRDLGVEIHRRLSTFSGHLSRLGRALGSGVEAYNSAVGSLERQVMPAARRFSELGLKPDKEIETLDPVEKLARESTLTDEDENMTGQPPPARRRKRKDPGLDPPGLDPENPGN